VNIRGGGENYSYYLSGNRLDQDGLLRASPENFNRNTFNVNLAGKLSKKVRIEYIGGFNWTKYEAPSYLQWGFFYTNSRRIAHQPYRYEDGAYASDMPVALRDGGRYVQNRDQNQHKLTLSYDNGSAEGKSKCHFSAVPERRKTAGWNQYLGVWPGRW
jgi:hypothetical protein